MTATEVARRFSQVLDSVEHGNESFRVIRGGRPIARISPVGRANGRAVLEFLTTHRPDAGWEEDLLSVRAMLHDEESPWRD